MEFIKENRKKLLILVGILLLVTLGISYAYFSVGGKQDDFITFKAGSCLSITITEESEEINLDKVLPVTIEEGLTYTPYTFTIKNNCSAEAPYQVAVESINMTDNTMGIENIHVSLEDSMGRVITERLDKLDSTNISINNSYDARKIFNGKLAGNSTTYFKFRMWLDYDATVSSAAGKTYQSKIVITARDNVELTEEVIKIAYKEEESTVGSNGWYKSYKTKAVITDTKDNNLKAKYCVGESKCEPDKDVTVENNSFEFTYPNGANYLCSIASDSKGNRSTITCNEIIKVDTKKPTINYVLGDNTAGSNNWYQNLKVRIEGQDSESGVASIKYCVTTDATCEPTTTVNEANTEVTINTNNKEQKICAKATDQNDNESEIICSSNYKVDGINPTVNVTLASSTVAQNGWYTAVSIKGEGQDTESAITNIKYCTTTSTTCTPNTNVNSTTTTVALTSNANAQKVCFQATDSSGRVSGVTCSSTYKVDASTTTINLNPTLPTVGTNSWYKSGSITITGTNNYSKIANIKYCTTTSTTCTPNTNVAASTTTVTLASNTAAQKVCATATDNKGTTTGVKCSSAYKIDTTAPVVTITSTSVTTDSITMNVSKTEAHSGIKSYYYKIGNGSYAASTATSKTFTGLASNTNYTVYVYAIDNAGNQSTVASKTVTTQKKGSETILGKITVNSGTPDFSKTSCSSGCEEATVGVYKANDNDGTSYYWRGDVTNNYLKFANKWWRIIRINGDGTIRIIYDGTQYHANGTNTSDSIAVTNTAFNSISSSEVFKYGTTKSTILSILETWYTNNLATYASRIDTNAGFCGDSTGSGSGKGYQYFADYVRLVTNKEPVLTCANSNYLHTVSSSTKGNKSLEKPIGLINANEVAMAGGKNGSNNFSYYLCNGRNYWTISPFYYATISELLAYVSYVNSTGNFIELSVSTAIDVRPVINLKADVAITGSGTQNDPFVVS